MSFRMRADEKVGRTHSAPYMTVTMKRTATLTNGLDKILCREVTAVALDFHVGEHPAIEINPAHLGQFIELLQQAQERVNDMPAEDEVDD